MKKVTTLRKGLKKRIHVNQHIIKSNNKNNENKPCITVKQGKRNIYGHQVKVNGVTEVVQSQTKPLSCGARVWVETIAEVEVYVE